MWGRAQRVTVLVEVRESGGAVLLDWDFGAVSPHHGTRDEGLWYDLTIMEGAFVEGGR